MIRRQYVDTAAGLVHVTTGDDGAPIVLVHQTPRSADEFAEVLPWLADAGRRPVAVDLPGMGRSDPIGSDASIERYATAVVEVCDALPIDRFAIAGHHTGAVVALEVAARAPDRVTALVLSSCPWVDADARRRRQTRAPIDAVAVNDSGEHLVELWHRRQSFYPSRRPDLLQRYVRDALMAEDPEAGHLAVGRYEMEARAPLVRAPSLCVGHTHDPHSHPDLHAVASAVSAEVVEIDGGMVPLEFTAPQWFDAVVGFLAGVESGG